MTHPTVHAPAPGSPPVARPGPQERAARLERLLGPAADPDNPLGTAAVLAADERGELLPEGERMLAGYGLNAEFVPRSLGGRFEQADAFAHLMRSVFRRDCSLGIGHGVTSFIAGLPVWASGSPEQQRRAASLLLSGGRIVAAYTELAHGSDFSRTGLAATPGPDGSGSLRLHGGKQLINNIARAEAAVLFARTDTRTGSRSHSHLLVDLTGLPPGAVRRDFRYPTSGVRGCLLGGIEFQDCPVPGDAVLGEPGDAMETVLRAFQVTRSVLPGMVVGVGDTQLRAVLGFALERQLYGGPVTELPYPRATLTGSFADLLVCDALATVGARSLHLLPGETSVQSAAVKYLVPKLLQDSSYRLSVLLGARSYLRTGPYALFQKAARDLPVVALAHAGSAVCLATIVPQLPRLAANGWPRQATDTAGPAGELFRPGAPLPPLDFSRLELNSRGRDTLSQAVTATAYGHPHVAALARLFAEELHRLAPRAAALPPRDRTVIASRRGFLLADRYAHVLAAAACLGVWQHGDGFAGDPAWVICALHRLAERLGLRPGPPPEEASDALFAELLRRHEENLTLDLIRTPLV
ncbi:acyl-CoA dehydrogenase family protein [Streptomyces sp. ISL-96]|uniref:acyl-CoA dehydrogenase family protein n=1 Tax=Streptomyces sp. ISL-96 TaxID=2819191 RepID=UPI001BECFB67|nr:acyl-CoA dehydrogenase family protein [Streptomyces sp. ISL-96]MBT2491907.1 acyl-CoA dehydrogenase family protein [Streptomyces sp. ISL-96]